MIMVKEFVSSRVGNIIIGTLIFLLMFICAKLVLWRHENRPHFTRLRNGGSNNPPPILVFWHEHLFCFGIVLPPGCAALQSPHADGRILDIPTRFYGVSPVWGSSNRQALSSLRALARETKRGKICVITPDGPRGPARMLSAGPVSLAQLTGASIIPVAWSTGRMWRARSWDRLRIPKPFTRGLIKWGDPIILASTKNKQELEAQRLLVETRLSALTQQCDSDMGHSKT